MVTSEKSSSYLSENIIFFDGICNFCHFWVQVLLKWDKRKVFKFCSLQDPCVRTLLGDRENHPDSIIYWKKGKIFYKSRAVLAIISDLGGIWLIFSVCHLIPRLILDKVYDFIAQRRYSWFGQRKICYVPTTEEKSRFLETGGDTN